MKPSAATTREQSSSTSSPLPVSRTTAPSTAVSPASECTTCGVSTRTEDARSWVTEPACAVNCGRRCTSVTDFAIGSRVSAQSTALSPPPTTSTSCPAYSSGAVTK